MVLQYMFLSLYDGVTNVLCVSLLSPDRYQQDSLIPSQTDLSISLSTLATAVVMRCGDVVLTSRKNAWKKIFIFPLRYYTNCVSTVLKVLILHNAESVYFFYSNPVISVFQKTLVTLVKLKGK
jgi:hypothetical protein